LTGAVLGRLDALAAALMRPEGVPAPDLTRPEGEPGLFALDSVTWRVFRNPVSLLVGGVAAVLLELAHPAVREGVWRHGRFREDPLGRIRRTGHAAMLTVYAPRSVALPAIARVVRRHEGIAGRTPDGRPFRASDPELLGWVHATAVHGFAAAYDRHVRALGEPGLSDAFAESAPVGRLHGVRDPPTDLAGWHALLKRTAPDLEPSPILEEFLGTMRTAPLLPGPLRALQPPAMRAAAGLVPEALRGPLGLAGHRPSQADAALLRMAAGLAERVRLPSHPASQAVIRLRAGARPGGRTPTALRGRHSGGASPEGRLTRGGEGRL
jgi:uncharacterized protein (DUF2236 family)